jgi:hypothetical protein
VTARNHPRHPPTFAELTEACQRAYGSTGDREYLKAIEDIQDARAVRQAEIYARGGEEDADDTQPPPDVRLSSWAGTAWQRYREDIRWRPAQVRRGGLSRNERVLLCIAFGGMLWSVFGPFIQHIF